MVVEYDERWPELFAHEAALLREALGDDAVAIEHVGSTAVPGLAAKPVIDILIGLRDDELSDEHRRALRRLGYVSRERSDRRYFRKGTPRTHFLHVVRYGGEAWRTKLAFRDFLRADAAAAAGYAARKLELATHGNRAVYAAKKDEYVRAIRATSTYADFCAAREP
jgi:GrpB-like predicted nucleotidyltransferase (UPF0157 family)